MEETEREKKNSDMFTKGKFTRITHQIIEGKKMSSADNYGGFSVPEGFINLGIEWCILNSNTSIKYIKIGVVTPNQRGSAEFDVVAYDSKERIVFIGELKSWINLKKLKEDIARITLGMEQNKFVAPVYYFIGHVVVEKQSEIEEWRRFLKTTSIRCYEVVFREQEIQWIQTNYDNYKNSVENFKIKNKCFSIIKKIFSIVFNSTHNILRNKILREIGMRRKAGLVEEKKYHSELPRNLLTKFRKEKDYRRSQLFSDLRKWKVKMYAFHKLLEKERCFTVLKFLKKHVRRHNIIKKTKQMVHFNNIAVFAKFFNWLMVEISLLQK